LAQTISSSWKSVPSMRCSMAAKLRQLFLPEHWAATGLSLGSVLPAPFEEPSTGRLPLSVLKESAAPFSNGMPRC
jgi:hypothetical protein